MRRLVEKRISRTKGTEYHLDKRISNGDLTAELYLRAKMLLRGFFTRIKLKGAGKSLFVGKRVTIKCGKNMCIGNSATINENCYINSMCKNNVFIGNNFSLGRNSLIDCTGVISELGESLKIGDNVGISPNFTLFVRGNVIIGNDVIIGPNVTMVAENHVFDDLEKPIRLQGTRRKGITVGNNCWIGANVTILDGVCIGDNSIIAAGAVINKDVESNTIVGGVPGKMIKKRV